MDLSYLSSLFREPPAPPPPTPMGWYDMMAYEDARLLCVALLTTVVGTVLAVLTLDAYGSYVQVRGRVATRSMSKKA